MWRFRSAALRERTSTCYHRAKVSSNANAPHSNGKRFQHDLALQLDYYMSPQFCGVASAIVNGSYSSKGIDLTVLPTCPVGEEQASVRTYLDANPSVVGMGTVEQNIFIPTLQAKPDLKCTAVAAMFGESPLCIASLNELSSDSGIGTHEDTVDIMRRILDSDKAVASPRSSKINDLLSNKYEGIQAYTTTEVPTLRRALDGKDPIVTRLEGLNGAKLGYSQVLFAADECLQDDRRAIIEAFCEATCDGWEHVIRNPKEAVEMVKEAQKMLGLDDESNDHWHPSDDFMLEMTEKCGDYVKGTFEGDRYGVIDKKRWDEANGWLLQGKSEGEIDGFGLDAAVWQPSQQLLSGNNLARSILSKAKSSAECFQKLHGRKPSLAVVTVGDLERYKQGDRRREIYSTASESWFNKTAAGEANGFVVKEIRLNSSATTDELLSQIYTLRDFDGIQVMWPMPDHIDTARVYSAINFQQDVDGIHYIGQTEIGNENAYPPVTPAATVALLDEFDVEVKGKRVLVIGRSPIVGSPIAHMMREMGAAVTVAHNQVPLETLKEIVGEAEVIISCAGMPGAIKAEWINGAVVVNVGTTFDEVKDSLVSDFDGDIEKNASRFSPVPGGIGPLSLPILLNNVAKAAWDGMGTAGSVLSNGWELETAKLRKKYHFDSYKEALDAAKKVDKLSTVMDHHANMQFTHKCVDGVDLELEFFTFEAKQITQKDYDAAQAVDMILSANQVKMSRYSYELDEKSIAQYPASPRGSSKLLRCEANGNVAYHGNFSKSFASMVRGCHLVFNDSRVLDARLFVKDGSGSNVELMILDLGSIDVEGTCVGTPLQAMIRSSEVKAGDVFQEFQGKGEIEVVEVKGIWEEDEKSDGNGTECFVRIKSNDSVEDYLASAGSVPIPPYLSRESQETDKEAYNNTYAENAGSVAAPTAGLHFTEAVLNEIGEKNCSYLSLHVGAGTFKPVMVDDARDHEMHAESFAVSVRELKRIIAALKEKKPLIVVGTTSSRTLESLYWCGAKRVQGLDNSSSNNLFLGQFDWVPLKAMAGRSVSRVAALEALVEGLGDDDIVAGSTALMISPPNYEFMVVDHLVTNFHAPDSTLMLLVAAFMKDGTGSKIRQIYENAQKNSYRFLSYGDVCMFSRPGS
mmetsp:Transcript_4068/g.9411  ORF Transcript_4068/g.9411 Transcript_4068/m.9411 type:complete len:1141 (-) Transcript_4068:76-3498(-)